MEDGERRERETAQRGVVVEVGNDGYDAMTAQARNLLGAAHDADDARLASHHLRGTQGHVAAADQENPDQFDARVDRTRGRNLRK